MDILIPNYYVIIKWMKLLPNYYLITNMDEIPN